MTLEQMCRAIAEAGQNAMGEGPYAAPRRVLFEQAVKEVRNIRANAMKWGTFLKQTPDVARKAKKVRHRAERRLAQFIIAMKEAGFLTDGLSAPGYKIGTRPKDVLTIKQLGIGPDESKQWQKLARMSEEEFEKWLDKPLMNRLKTTTRPSPPAGSLKHHPLADIFPLMEGPDFDALVADIKANGLRETIDLFEGGILDGRNRSRACKKAGVEPKFKQYRGSDPLGYVISKNLKRRHLNESQRAMVAAKLATLKQGARTDLAEISAKSQPEAAAMLNVSRGSVQNATKVIDKGTPDLQKVVEQGHLPVSAAAQATKLPPEQQRQIAQEATAGRANVVRKAIKQGARQAREAELGDAQAAGNLALPTKRYGVILADPEWRFEPYSRETGIDRAADNHYPTSPLDVIKARDVPSISADDCVLFLWATAPMLPEALEVLKAWGFDYRSQIIWHKERIGTGYWFRNEHELLLVGTRGNIPAPAMGTQWRSLCASPSGVHSEKPGWQYELIEAYFPTLSKIELNARRARPGWDCWGVEAPPHVEAIAPPQVATGRMKWLSIKKLEADIDELPLDENGVPLQPAWWDGSADEWFELVEFKGCPPAKTPDLPSTT